MNPANNYGDELSILIGKQFLFSLNIPLYLLSILIFTVGTRTATRTVTFIYRWWDQWQTCSTMLTWIRLAWIIKDNHFITFGVCVCSYKIYIDNDLHKLKLWVLHHFYNDSKHHNSISKKTIYCSVKSAFKRIHGNIVCMKRFIQNMHFETIANL